MPVCLSLGGLHAALTVPAAVLLAAAVAAAALLGTLALGGLGEG